MKGTVLTESRIVEGRPNITVKQLLCFAISITHLQTVMASASADVSCRYIWNNWLTRWTITLRYEALRASQIVLSQETSLL
jgi:hypothetical protein